MAVSMAPVRKSWRRLIIPKIASWVEKIPWRRVRLTTPVFFGFPGSSKSSCNAGDLGWEDPLEEGMATHSSILA